MALNTDATSREPRAAAFGELPSGLDHVALEHQVLRQWESERTFEALRRKNAEGPTWSFIDGPITANNSAGVHHCHGRTLKDVFQRYRALRGFNQRYQNGFDCQGLWVEVEVERSLGLNSKREIEEYGLADFAARCKERVAHYSEVITDQSKRLGMWMDWDNDYYTFSDTNISYIWRFLRTVHERGWLYRGHRATPWCPRCGTSLSQHEQIDSYAELVHPSLLVRFRLIGRQGEALAVWTTTPWTLPANVAVAVNPEAEYVLLESGEWVARDLAGDARFLGAARGEDLVGLEYQGPFDHLPAQRDVTHTVIPWPDVAMDEGTGLVHIAPGCGAEDFALGRVNSLPVLAPIDESGRFLDAYGPLAGRRTDEVTDSIVVGLEQEGLLISAGTIEHRYPVCWRCRTPLVFRIVDDWFISVQELRDPMLDGNAAVRWTPPFYSKRMDDWLRNMDDWNISRQRFFGLPLPFYPCEDCGRLNVVGSVEELRERATAGLEQLQELHRPWIDEVLISCDGCSRSDLRRIADVGDAWLDAGIVPFSTLGWQNRTFVPGGYSTGAARGLSGADLPDHRYWETWFPADFISEMREQIRLWFYSQCFMSMTLVGRLPYKQVLTYEKVLDETGREMHKSWGNAIEASEALERMGADVMRWMFCEQAPSQPLRFGYGRASDIKRRLLTLWNSAVFLVTYANIEGFQPSFSELDEPRVADGATRLDGWLLARTRRLLRDVTAAYEDNWTPGVVSAFEVFVDDLSNWYIRRSRRRFYSYDATAFHVLWHALVQSLRMIAPVIPFLADFLWGQLVASPCADAPRSVFLAQWPAVTVQDEAEDDRVLAEMEEVRRVIELGRQARAAVGIKLRQPLRELVVEGAPLAEAHASEIEQELRMKRVRFAPVPAMQTRMRPNLPTLGPKLGRTLPEVQRALAEGRFEERDDGRVRVGEHLLEREDVLVEHSSPENWALAGDGRIHVALDTRLDESLRQEGRVLDLIHLLNRMRKEAGMAVTDRITVTIPEADADLMSYADTVMREVLAVSIDTGPGEAPEIARA